ncbi:MAG: hypothetical protein KGI04_00290 [Candidatus Micrarchaeota archaeon]|nr:hypothetical protein [Candidatus Micrarchaeota archaeon]
MKEKSVLYACSVCGLHYTDRETAEECYAWCSAHSSCRLSVARKSVEAKRAMGKK